MEVVCTVQGAADAEAALVADLEEICPLAAWSLNSRWDEAAAKPAGTVGVAECSFMASPLRS